METLQDLVAEGAARFDRRPALLIRPFFRTRTWRYRDLGAIVPRAARVLADTGIEPGDRVILWSVNRPEWGIAFFAIQHLRRRRGSARRPPYRRLRAEDRRPDGGEGRPRQPPDGGGRTAARSAHRVGGEPARRRPPRGADARSAGDGRDARRDRVHERHDRRAEGRDAQPRQPDRECDGDDDGPLVRREGPTAVGAAPVAPLRAGAGVHRPDDRRREHRVPGESPAGRARAARSATSR